MRVIGIDLGSKRIGLAISDEEGEFAFPAGIIESRGRKRNIEALRKMISEKKIGCAVIGLPVHMDGRRGPEAEKAVEFARALSQSSGIPVETLDERWTSQEAERILDSATKKRGAKRRKAGVVDEMAASIILRTYLAQRARNQTSDLDAAQGDG